MTYYVVFYRFKGTDIWLPAEQQSIPHSYESYPVLHEARNKAEAFAAKFSNEGGDNKYEVRVVDVTITPPEG